MKQKLSNITDFETLSFSKASTFNNCEKKFSFSYVEKIRTKSGIHAAVGTFVHLVIEEFYNNENFSKLIVKNYDSTLGYLETTFNNLWPKYKRRLQKLFNEESRKPEEYESLEDWVETLLKNYMELENHILENQAMYQDLIIDDSIKIFNEKQFKQNIKYKNKDNNEYEFELRGFIDRLILKNQPKNNLYSCSIVDLKTGKPSSFGKKEKKDQIKTYQFLVTKGKNKEIDKTENFIVSNGYLFFLGGKNVDPEKRILKVDKTDFADLENFVEESFSTTHKNIIQNRNFDIEMFESSSTSSPWKSSVQVLCSWCDYKHLCDEWLKKIIDLESVKKLNVSLNEIRHSGGINKLSKYKNLSFINNFDKTSHTMKQLIDYWNEVSKKEINLFFELISNMSMNFQDDSEANKVLNNLKKFMKEDLFEDDELGSQHKELMLHILKIRSEDSEEQIWKTITRCINFINENFENIKNINKSEFDNFVINSRISWKKFNATDRTISNYRILISKLEKFKQFKFYDFKDKSRINNFKKDIFELEDAVNKLILEFQSHKELDLLVKKSKEFQLTIRHTCDLVNRFENNILRLASII